MADLITQLDIESSGEAYYVGHGFTQDAAIVDALGKERKWREEMGLEERFTRWRVFTQIIARQDCMIQYKVILY